MSFFERFKNKYVTLLGAGVSNKPLIKMLADAGSKVNVRDKKTIDELGETGKALMDAGADFTVGENYLDNITGDYVFRSPGFRPDIEPLKKAVETGSVLTSEMKMFLENAPCPVIGITGSDGKSTTTTLTAKILEASGANCFLGGNIGEPLLHRIDNMKADDVVAAELSSFQLMDIDANFECAVIKNVTPNHLNWHTGMEEYIEAKARILKHCKRAVLNFDDEVCRRLAESAKCAELYWFSRSIIPESELSESVGAVYLHDGGIWVREPGSGEAVKVLEVDRILLPGEHNAENYATAIAATWGRASIEAIQDVAENFGGVKHRMEFVREKDGVRYYNSSIDSSPTRTAAAISCFKTPIVVICGGYDKNIPFEPLADALYAHGNVKAVVLTGATMEKIKSAMWAHKDFEKTAIKLICEKDFKAATLAAANAASAGDAVVLTPACASFDAFENFERRGEFFRDIVKEL